LRSARVDRHNPRFSVRRQVDDRHRRGGNYYALEQIERLADEMGDHRFDDVGVRHQCDRALSVAAGETHHGLHATLLRFEQTFTFGKDEL
jgi:hypothetical protein